MNVQIRHATAADAAALQALHSASWRASYAPFVPAAALGAPLDAHMRTRWYPWPVDRLILMAEDASVPLGFGAVVRGGAPLLDNLHVSPEARSGGVGGALFRALCAALAQEGAATLRLMVIAANPDARRFYRRLGGVEGPAQDEMLLGHSVAMVPVHFPNAVFRALAQEL